MRPILYFVLLLVFVFSVQMQSRAEVPDIDKATYILVDASGSIKEELTESKTTLRVALELLDEGQLRSITFFGEDPGDNAMVTCNDEIQISEPMPVGTKLPEYPNLGGSKDKTSIGKGLEAILAVGGADASIVLITDGDEECGADFVSIRREYPDAVFRVLQIGNAPNSALDVLELDLAGSSDPERVIHNVKPSLIFQGPFFEIGSDPNAAKRNQWNSANWLEKYLWLLCYVSLCTSAYMMSRAYNKMTEKVTQSIKAWEQLNRDQAEQENPSAVTSREDLPEYLDNQQISGAGSAFKERFFWMLGYATLLGLPLAILDGLEQVWVGRFALAFVLVSATAWAAYWFIRKYVWKRAKNQNPRSGETSALPLVERTIFSLGLFLSALVIYFFADFDVARNAAWVPLSSGFSAALTILASTPFLFTGSRWWAFQQEKHSYYIVSDGATRDKIRRKQEENRKTKNDWEDQRSRIGSIKIGNPLRGTSQIRMRPNKKEVFRTHLDTVAQRLKDLALESGGKAPNAQANERYRSILKNSKLRDLVQAVMSHLPAIADEETKLWNDLDSVLNKRRNDRSIESAVSNLARYLDRVNTTLGK